MRQHKTLPKALLVLGALSLATTAASAQDYVCPDGYYYVAGYGCAPLSYYDYPFLPDPGFGFFYGGVWGGRGYRPHGAGVPHGGGGFRGGGGFHGGGGHGGGGHR